MRLTGANSVMRLSGVLALTAALVGGPVSAHAYASDFTVPPVDPQHWQNQYDMTWADWKDIPGTNWNDPNGRPGERGLRIALVAVDFPDQPFVITQPKRSDPFGNPQIDPIQRADVPRFYHDFYLVPNEYNHGRTIHEYWMEQSRGRLGVEKMDTFGAYRLPRNLFEYGLNEFGQAGACPNGFTCNGNLDRDADTVWQADLAVRGIPCPDSKCGYNVVLRVYAGYDETSIWQEFGEMRFDSKEDIPDDWGPPASDTALPNWAPTRYVEWTSWRAAAQQWGQSSIRQAESSGTITHEMGHYFFDIGDNNNNPFSDRQNPPGPFHRVGSAPWDMMDRGSFNGPGGHHMRWVIPPNMGGWSPAGLMLRNRIHAGIVPAANVLEVSREALAGTGLVVATVTARAVDPGPDGTSGIKVRLDGPGRPDRTPDCDIGTDPFCHGNTGWDHYTLEVVDRMGFDSFTPDHGVIIAKNKTRESNTCGYNCFDWVIDANPGDIGLVDFRRPDGTPVMASIADHRQLNDAAFHAGLNSGSAYEWVDEPNRLHFYVIDVRRDAGGVLSYTLAVRSLDGSGPQRRGVRLGRPEVSGRPGGVALCTFPLTNTGQSGATPVDDVYRLSVSSRGRGWTAVLDNALATAAAGHTVAVPVYVSPAPGAAREATVTLTARSESDPAATRSLACTVGRRDTNGQ
ncbi:peptidase M6 [Actinophytocola oryzae]|uniref:M6 family metalloprotease-like protein n=1 Tax=Actinophytocola oryzae TaxID=502181 RepID=A0A4R7W3E2_9PSEU|nr:peptidase M6 [Actinophytocola oryzae]TDV56568.1 M6 family metalloprotease-like protein [Actinophytocola oryzae]